MPDVEPSRDAAFPAELDRLRRRAHRERQARLEAEAIAERSTRALYEGQRRLVLLERVAAAANEAADPTGALRTVLGEVCAYTGWPVGHAYRRAPDGAGRFVPAGAWVLPEGDPFGPFRAATEALTFGPGEGLPGEVVATGRPAWRLDVGADPGFRRGPTAGAAGLRAALAFPVLVGAEVAAVLEFFSTEATAPDPALLDAMAAVGAQLGRVFERARAADDLRRRERQLAEAEALAHLGHWDFDAATYTVVWSDELYRIFGFDPADGAPAFDRYLAAIHPDDRAGVAEAIDRALRDGRPYTTDHRVVRPDGTVRHVHGRGDVERVNGRVVRIYGTAQDVTAAALAAAERAAYAVRLEQSNRELQDFAHVASHDLQEPLRKIRAFADLLRLDAGPALPAVAVDHLGRIDRAAARMSALIHDLLALSRVGTRGERFRPVDLGAVLAGVLADLDVRLRETGGRVEVAGPLPTIIADPSQMHQLLLNLVGNGLKFHRPGVAPVVTVAARAEAAEVVVEVADNGVGFDAKYAERIFRPFERLHSRDAYDGTGIGLAIVRRIAERHGGTVTAEGEPGRGAAFRVRLSHRPAPIGASPSPADPASSDPAGPKS